MCSVPSFLLRIPKNASNVHKSGTTKRDRPCLLYVLIYLSTLISESAQVSIAAFRHHDAFLQRGRPHSEITQKRKFHRLELQLLRNDKMRRIIIPFRFRLPRAKSTIRANTPSHQIVNTSELSGRDCFVGFVMHRRSSPFKIGLKLSEGN